MRLYTLKAQRILLVFCFLSCISSDAWINRKSVQETLVLLQRYVTSFIRWIRPLESSVAKPKRKQAEPVPSSKGSSPYARRTSAANPSRPLRVSVRPTASITRLIPAASLSMVNHRQNRRQCFFADRIPEFSAANKRIGVDWFRFDRTRYLLEDRWLLLLPGVWSSFSFLHSWLLFPMQKTS